MCSGRKLIRKHFPHAYCTYRKPYTPWFYHPNNVIRIAFSFLSGIYNPCELESSHSWGHMITHNTPQSVDSSGWMISLSQRPLPDDTHNTYNTQTSVPPGRFEPAIPVGDRPQTCDLGEKHTYSGAASSLWFNSWKKSTALFPRIKSQAAGRPAPAPPASRRPAPRRCVYMHHPLRATVCVFVPVDRSATGIGYMNC
jgi:hypothetical protein